MSVKYQDYYKILGIERKATADEIKNAYKKMAKKFHPDVNKSKNAEETFKKVNEAYEVLKDPEKRKLYDQFGENWQSGQDFNPGDFAGFRGAPGGYQQYTYSSGGVGSSGFSDFFESIFGGGFSGFSDFGGRGRGSQQSREVFRTKGSDRKAKITLSIKEAYNGGQKTIVINTPEQKKYQVNIPPGSITGNKLRLKNMGDPGLGGGPSGDLIIEIVVANDSKYRLDGKDIIRTIEIPFYEAILGTKKNVNIFDKNIEIKIPAGTQSNQKLRIKDMGMPSKDGKGDLFLEIKVKIPKDLTHEQVEFIEKAKEIFN